MFPRHGAPRVGGCVLMPAAVPHFLAAVLTVAVCAAGVAVTAAVDRSLSSDACRAEAAAALISADHCALR